MIGALVEEAAGQGGAGIVDQHADGRVARAAASSTLATSSASVRSAREHIDRNAGLAPQPLGEGLDARAVACDQHEIMAATGETVGIDRADAARSAGDEDGGG